MYKKNKKEFEKIIYGGKRGRYDQSAACSNAFRPSAIFFEDTEGGSGEEAK